MQGPDPWDPFQIPGSGRSPGGEHGMDRGRLQSIALQKIKHNCSDLARVQARP